MKRKFDILFEEIMTELQPVFDKSYIEYNVIGDKVQQITQEIQALQTAEEKIAYAKNIWQTGQNIPGQQSALKEVCYELYGDDPELNPLYSFLKPYKVLPMRAKVKQEEF